MNRLNSYDTYDPDKHGPLFVAFWGTIAFAVVVALIWGISTCFGVVAETQKVAQEQFGARALLQKYEWFKDAHAALDAKRANIAVYESRFQRLEKEYSGTPRNKWPEDERQQANIWASELAGLVASYNALAADYNAQMAKFNYRFANVGTLPAGATEALPREYAPYQTSY